MSTAGYGRGYYGTKQLAKEPRRGGVSGWIKLALVAGAGGVIWFMWPKKAPPPGFGPDYDDGPPPPPPPPSGILRLQIEQPQIAQPVQPVQFAQPAQIAQPAQPPLSQGYATTKAYEDAVVASAKHLQDSGTKVVLAPHLAHLASRLAP